MDIKNLSIFVEVCRCGSISKASEKCFVSRQGISQIIARLEEDIKYPLLDRTNSGVQPTPAGKILLEAADEILASYNRCLNRIDKLTITQQIDIVFAPGAYYRLDPAIKEFRQKHPDCTIHIMECVDAECEEYVKNGTAELAFTPGPIYDNTLSAQHLLTIPFVAFFKEGHPLSDKTEISLQDLEGQQIIVQGPQHKIYIYLNKELKNRHIHATLYHLYDALLQFNTVEELGVIGISTERIAQIMRMDTMCYVPCNPTELAWNLNVVKLKDKKLSPLTKDLYDIILQFSHT